MCQINEHQQKNQQKSEKSILIKIIQSQQTLLIKLVIRNNFNKISIGFRYKLNMSKFNVYKYYQFNRN